jgi:hypothetical protein
LWLNTSDRGVFAFCYQSQEKKYWNLQQELKFKISTDHKAICEPRMPHVMPDTGDIENEHFFEAQA